MELLKPIIQADPLKKMMEPLDGIMDALFGAPAGHKRCRRGPRATGRGCLKKGR